MNFLRASYLKKTAASLFMLLFVFVHAVKALHTHENIAALANNTAGKNADWFKADYTCNICDFQIAKDSDAVIECIKISAPESFLNYYYNYIISSFDSIPVVSSGTDPPAFA